jgi:hypothetical protein
MEKVSDIDKSCGKILGDCFLIYVSLSTSGRPASDVTTEIIPARTVDDTTTLQSTVAITFEEPIVAMNVCAIVFIALIVAALSHAFVFIAFTSFFY